MLVEKKVLERSKTGNTKSINMKSTTMTPTPAQSKARELVDKFLFADIYFTNGKHGAFKNAKACALISINFTLEILNGPGVYVLPVPEVDKFLMEVRDEIEKL